MYEEKEEKLASNAILLAFNEGLLLTEDSWAVFTHDKVQGEKR